MRKSVCMQICHFSNLVLVFLALSSSLAFAAESCKVAAFFSPYDNVEAEVVSLISGAEKTVHCSLYGITNVRITEAMSAAVERGVEVQLCLDKTQSGGKCSTHKKLRRAGAEVVIKKTGVLEHNKFCVIDGDKIIMGSWNFSNSAQRQDNSNVEISGCPDIVKEFEDAFSRIHERDKRP